MFEPKKILVPVDFSEESQLAFDWAAMLAKGQPGASIYLCHVLVIPITPMGPEAMDYGYLSVDQTEAEEMLAEMKAGLPPGLQGYDLICRGRPAAEIVRLAEKHGIDLILLTTHGRKGFARALHGSITEEVVRLAPCPVLVLHLTRTAVEAVHRVA